MPSFSLLYLIITWTSFVFEGFFLGLTHLLTGESNFDKILEMANSGNNKETDLYVSDIYGSMVPPEDIHGDALCVRYILKKYTKLELLFCHLQHGKDVNEA